MNLKLIKHISRRFNGGKHPVLYYQQGLRSGYCNEEHKLWQGALSWFSYQDNTVSSAMKTST